MDNYEIAFTLCVITSGSQPDRDPTFSIAARFGFCYCLDGSWPHIGITNLVFLCKMQTLVIKTQKNP